MSNAERRLDEAKSGTSNHGNGHTSAERSQDRDITSPSRNSSNGRENGPMATVGKQISSFGDTIRETMPDSGRLGTAAVAVADHLNSSGQYLRTHGYEDIANDVTELVRRHPAPAILFGLGLGVLVGRLLARK